MNPTLKLRYLTLFFSVIIITLFTASGCGSDNNTVNNINNPPVNNDSLIYSLDSLVLRGIGFHTIELIDTLLDPANNDSIKLSFSLESNCTNQDSAGISLEVSSIGMPSYFLILIDNSQLFNSSFNYFFRIENYLTYFRTSILFNSHTLRYLIIKNIKIFTLH